MMVAMVILGRPWFDVFVTFLLVLTALTLALLIRRERYLGRFLALYFLVKTVLWGWVIARWAGHQPGEWELNFIKSAIAVACILAISSVVYERLIHRD